MKFLYFLLVLFLMALSSGLTYLFVTKTSSSAPLPSLYQKISEYQTKYQPLLKDTAYYLNFRGTIKYLSGANFAITNGTLDLPFISNPKTKTPIIFQERNSLNGNIKSIKAKDVAVGDVVEVSARLDVNTGNLIPDFVVRITP